MGETVRERLEKLAKSSLNAASKLPRMIDLPENVKAEDPKPITPSSVMVQKIERSIKIIEDYHKKMLDDSHSYLSLFYELKKAEKEFLALLKEAEEKEVSIPSPFMKRIESVKSKIRDKPLQ